MSHNCFVSCVTFHSILMSLKTLIVSHKLFGSTSTCTHTHTHTHIYIYIYMYIYICVCVCVCVCVELKHFYVYTYIKDNFIHHNRLYTLLDALGSIGKLGSFSFNLISPNYSSLVKKNSERLKLLKFDLCI